jgi:hypothetical protein
MKYIALFPLTALLAGLALSGTASAALFIRPGGMVYDSGRNITWLADANYAQTSGYDADGQMDWATAVAWADELVFGGYSDWRLPMALNADGSGPCVGFNCSGSELGHLYYNEIGATAGNSILTGNATELAKFSNVQTFLASYWSGTEYAPDTRLAWYFSPRFGSQHAEFKYAYGGFYAWAVRSGDVTAAVPELDVAGAPLALAFLAGALALTRRRG